MNGDAMPSNGYGAYDNVVDGAGDREGGGSADGFDVIGLGELLVDFTQVGTSAGGQALYERNPGGAPANMLATCASMGLNCAFVGKVGADAQGDFLRNSLLEAGVNVAGLVSDTDVFTTLSFVQVNPDTGERSFAFARKPGADTLLQAGEIDFDRIRAARVLHVGSLSLTDEPARSATIAAVAAARDSGTLVSYDPNWRPSLWHDSSQAVAEMNGMVARCDLMKASLEEAELLTCENDVTSIGSKPATSSNVSGSAAVSDVTRAVIAGGTLLHREPGPRLVAITMGDEGAFVATRSASAFIPAYEPAEVVDTTGAGDVFWGSFVEWLIDKARVRARNDLDSLDAATLTLAGSFACAAASVCVEKHGGLPSVPTLDEVVSRLDGGKRG